MGHAIHRRDLVLARTGTVPLRHPWETALWPKDGHYIVPVKTAVRRAENVDEGDTVTIGLELLAATRR